MLKIYNTLSRKKEILKGRKGKKLSVFVCGITTYDFSHIGHARTYVAFDMIVKYLRQTGHDVFYLQNVTDVEDKIIQRAREVRVSPKALAGRFEKEYRTDMKALGVDSVTKYARATDYILEIISQVERLLKKGYAYKIENDGIYFDISKFKEYGKLSRRTIEQAQDAVSRIDESVGKRNKGDFALWKYSKSGEPMWDFKTGKYLGVMGRPAYAKASAGKPGWHIEDTAITEKFFGPQYDIHGGAQDLIFPHHEAEITQMESVSGKKPFVKVWMHTGFLTVKGEKMSKSLGNFITIRDFLENYPARLLRFFVLKTHYRSPIDYSDNVLEQAKSELERIDEFIDKLETSASAKAPAGKQNSKLIKTIRKRFFEAIDDDFNTPLAISILFDLIREGNTLLDQDKMTKTDAKEILDFFKEIDSFFGFIFWGREKQIIPKEIQKLSDQREQFRKQKNWAKSDKVRQQIERKGWLVEDISSGSKLKKKIK